MRNAAANSSSRNGSVSTTSRKPTQNIKTSLGSERRRKKKGKSSGTDRKSTRLNSSHVSISYAVFCLKKKKNTTTITLRRKRHEYLTKWAPRSPDRRISTSHWKGLSLRPNYFP